MEIFGQKQFLHYVFKVANRKETVDFFRSVLGMQVLRHEEFNEGCKATCNGPYDGKWSKTMIGYGPEDDFFVAELTYNYGIKEYKQGNGFMGMVIRSKDIVERAKEHKVRLTEEREMKAIKSPGGYTFLIQEEFEPFKGDPVKEIILACSDLVKSINYWNDVLGMELYEKYDGKAFLGYGKEQCRLILQEIEDPINHGENFGRIAFSCPTHQLSSLQSKVREAGGAILTPLVSLDTPGKSTVHVIILADPDGHEICFVGREAFRELSKVDEEADNLLDTAIADDKSNTWFLRKRPAND